MFQEKVNKAVTALDELATALTEGLFLRLAEVNEPLQQEADAKVAESIQLRQSHDELQRRVEAQGRVLAADIDRAVSEGRDGDAEAKRLEGAELTANLRSILNDAETCERRVREIGQAQKQNSRAIFEATYPSIRESTVAVQVALVWLLDRVWDDLQRYGIEGGHTGNLGVPPLVRQQHKADLTPREYPPERAAFDSLQRWLGGRR